MPKRKNYNVQSEEIVNDTSNAEVVENVEPEEKPTYLVEVANCERLNVREEASSTSKVITIVNKSDVLRVLSEENEFLKVITNDNITGFVMKKFTK